MTGDTEKAFAKINLGLDIKGKRQDGFHDIDTILQSVELHDEIILRKTSGGIFLRTDSGDIPKDSTNLAFRAAQVFLESTGIRSGITIEIIKKIPVEAGLGGGSSDAAAVLRGMDRLFETGLSMGKMAHMAEGIGSDVPFCLEGHTQRATGRGEILRKLSPCEGLPLVILIPREKVSTGWAFSLYSGDREMARPDMDALERGVETRDQNLVAAHLRNVFEELVFPFRPMIRKAKYDMMDTGPLVCSMTGSGACVFGLYRTRQEAECALERLLGKGHEGRVTFTGKGPTL